MNSLSPTLYLIRKTYSTLLSEFSKYLCSVCTLFTDYILYIAVNINLIQTINNIFN